MSGLDKVLCHLLMRQLVTTPCSIGYLRVKIPLLDWASSFCPIPTMTPLCLVKIHGVCLSMLQTGTLTSLASVISSSGENSLKWAAFGSNSAASWRKSHTDLITGPSLRKDKPINNVGAPFGGCLASTIFFWLNWSRWSLHIPVRRHIELMPNISWAPIPNAPFFYPWRWDDRSFLARPPTFTLSLVGPHQVDHRHFGSNFGKPSNLGFL